jgi:hypothetical protein
MFQEMADFPKRETGRFLERLFSKITNSPNLGINRSQKRFAVLA